LQIRIASSADAQAVNEIYAYYIENSAATFNEQNKTVSQRAREIETLLRDYSSDNLYACAPGELDGKNIRLYARVAGQEDGEIHWYDLRQAP